MLSSAFMNPSTSESTHKPCPGSELFPAVLSPPDPQPVRSSTPTIVSADILLNLFHILDASFLGDYCHAFLLASDIIMVRAFLMREQFTHKERTICYTFAENYHPEERHK